MTKIIEFPGQTTNDIPVEKVLDHAKENLVDVVLVGYDENGNLFCASNVSSVHKIYWMIERLKITFLNSVLDKED